MSMSTIRRQFKNVAYNFSDAQIKTREATSNDPWGPQTRQMHHIAKMTNNPMSFIEIMSIIWKRLNDSGKQWRHVYKSLVLLDYLIKCGNEKVVKQCRENIYTIETLKDFEYFDGKKDQGLNIREKAKYITTLIGDEERLKNERMMNKENGSRRRKNTVVNEEEDIGIDYDDIQLQLALTMSKAENEEQEELKKSDDVRLQMALEESQRVVEQVKESAVDDLLSLDIVSGGSDANMDVWDLPPPYPGQSSSSTVNNHDNIWDMPSLHTNTDLLGAEMPLPTSSSTSTNVKTAAFNLLGENANLVDFDNLLGPTVSHNGGVANAANPFIPQQPTLNQIRHHSTNGFPSYF